MLVVFDLDGTLIDSRRDLADAANELIAEHGGAPLPVDAIAGMVGEGAALLVRRALAASRIDDIDERAALDRFLALYDDRLLAHTQLYDGIQETITELSLSASLGVLTNKPLAATRKILDGLGIASAFRWVLGGDGPHSRKPDPAGLRQIMADAGSTPEDTTMVGDSRIDLETARAAGCAMCVAAYGFGFRPDVSLRGDEVMATHPRQIASLLLSRR